MQLSRAAKRCLETLCEPGATIRFDRREGKFAIHVGGEAKTIQSGTVDVLDRCGVIARMREVVPAYQVNAKGLRLFEEMRCSSE